MCWQGPEVPRIHVSHCGSGVVVSVLVWVVVGVVTSLHNAKPAGHVSCSPPPRTSAAAHTPDCWCMQGPVEPNWQSEQGSFCCDAEHKMAPAFALQVPAESDEKQRPELTTVGRVVGRGGRGE